MSVLSKTVSVTPVIDTSAYGAGDCVGGLMTFDVSTVLGGGTIESILIADDDNEKAQAILYIYNALPSTIADQAAYAPTIADLKKLVYVKPVASADFTTVNSNAYALYSNLRVTYAASKLYVYLACVATPTYTAATDLTIALTVKAGG
jgi:hypothetical protein